MAVGAADIALLDLRKDDRPGTTADHRADGHPLCGGIAMVELKDHDVGLAAIDAWV
ncbi:MAG: hypothetical protein ACRDGE_00605 [Candidatus Limnocylindria bacterium]